MIYEKQGENGPKNEETTISGVFFLGNCYDSLCNMNDYLSFSYGIT
jgi:hypothetical protein